MTLHPAWLRVGVASAVGTAAAALFWTPLGPDAAIAVGWVVLTLVFCLWTGAAILRFDAEQTQAHATDEDPSHAVVTGALTLASLASVGGVGILLSGTHHGQGAPVESILGAAVVVCSWLLVHALYTVHYARLYYAEPDSPGIDFNGDQPDYHDFAYLAFTLGMTYQVSDTALQTRPVRRAVLQHALLSYLLGAVVLACTINLVVQLAAQG